MSQVIPLGPAARMLTTREAAQRLGVSLRTVQLWVEADILPAARTPGGHRRIPYNAVEALALSTGLGGEPLARGQHISREGATLRDMWLRNEDAAHAAPAREPDQGAAKQAAPLDVLIVADDPGWQERCADAMRPYGEAVKLRYAETGYLALIQIGQGAPDLLVTHLELPGMDGFGMLRTLERCESIAAMHVLVLTDMGEHEVARRGGLPPIAELMRLPVTPEAIAVRVGRRLIGRRTG